MDNARLLQKLEHAITTLRKCNGSCADINQKAYVDPPHFKEVFCKLQSHVHNSTQEPVRIIHHLSCTGGTLISKCIASMPNVLLLNEIDPLSRIPFQNRKPRFTPTDMIALLRQADPEIEDEILEALFIEQLKFVYKEARQTGRTLVLREHSHSHFLQDNVPPDRSSLRDIVSKHLPVKSIVTIRDPMDSFTSMEQYGWHKHFSPSTFEEYCRRYQNFLEYYANEEVIKYEDFVAKPKETMQKICSIFRLEYNPDFEELYEAFSFSGDSGRSGGKIEMRQRR